jgi:undecaprenyl-diphosphatase
VPLSHILILAVIQGIAEFVPVSSSGHLVVIEALIGQTQDRADVNIVLHLGTLVSILVFYWHRIWRLVGTDRRVIPRLIVGTIPAAVVGLLIERHFEGLLESALLSGCMLLVNGAILLYTAHWPSASGRYQELSYARTWWIGVCQAVALLPGISRSGATISSGLMAGLARQDAATFSFLLAIPAIAGASMLKLTELIGGAELSTPAGYLLIGALVSFVVGLFALWWLLSWLQQGRLEYFGYWCLVVGAAVVLWQLQ